MLKEKIIAYGHENIKATHKTTLQITKDHELTPRGDCIIGVSANKSISEIDEKIKKKLKNGKKAKIVISLPDYGISEELYGFGDKRLTFKHESDIVVRKSKFTCDRTLLINSNKSALNLNRELVELLKNRKTEIHFIIFIDR